MKLDDIQPSHCYSLARRLWAESRSIREELGRQEDTRPVPQVTGAEPREVYFEACAVWRKATRLGAELGADGPRSAPAAPALQTLHSGHVHRVLEGVLAQVDDIKQRLGITGKAAQEPLDSDRQQSDVLVTLVRVNRELSRALERPLTPSDVFSTVSLASAYVDRSGGHALAAPYERGRQPAECYERLEACLSRATTLIAKRGHQALAVRGAPPDIVPDDVYDLAHLVLGEAAYLHALTPDAEPIHAFELPASGHRLLSHVHQIARTLEAQLATLA